MENCQVCVIGVGELGSRIAGKILMIFGLLDSYIVAHNVEL